MIGLAAWSGLPARTRGGIVAAAAAIGAIALYSAGELGIAAAGALAFVALLAGAAALGRRSTRSGPEALVVVARAPLTRDAGLAVVVWRGAELLVGHGPTGVAVLARESRPGVAP